MGIGTSVLLLAVGAVLRYAVTDTVEGVNLATVGLILMIAGVLGFVLSLLWASMWRGRRAGVVEPDEPVVYRERRSYGP